MLTLMLQLIRKKILNRFMSCLGEGNVTLPFWELGNLTLNPMTESLSSVNIRTLRNCKSRKFQRLSYMDWFLGSRTCHPGRRQPMTSEQDAAAGERPRFAWPFINRHHHVAKDLQHTLCRRTQRCFCDPSKYSRDIFPICFIHHSIHYFFLSRMKHKSGISGRDTKVTFYQINSFSYWTYPAKNLKVHFRK